MFRKKLVIVVVILTIIIVVIRLFFLDALLSRIMVKTGEVLFGAKVEVGQVKTNLREGRMEVYDLAVADKDNPYRNLFSFESSVIDINPFLLLYRKYHVDEMTVDGLQFGSKRETSGLLRKEEAAPSKKVAGFIEDIKDYYSLEEIQQRLQLEEITDLSELKTLESLEEARIEVESFPEDVNKTINELALEKRINAVQSDARQIIENPPQQPQDYPEYLRRVEIVISKVQRINEDIDKARSNLQAQFKTVQESVGQVVVQSREDLEEIKSKIEFVQYKSGRIMEDIIGPKYVAMIEQARQILNVAQKFMPDKVPEKESWTDRFLVEGQDIWFPITSRAPKFLLGTARLSGEWPGSQQVLFLGEIKEVVANQDIRGIPTTLRVWSGEGQQVRIDGEGVLDFRDDKQQLHFDLTNTGLALLPSYWDTELIPFVIKEGTMALDVSFDLTQRYSKSNLGIKTSGAVFEPTESFNKDNFFHRILADVLISTDTFTINGSYNNGELQITSNIDSMFANKMQSYLDTEYARLRQNIEEQWNEKVVSRIDEVRSRTGELQDQVQKTIATYRAQLDDLKRQLEAERKKYINLVESEKKRLEEEARKKQQEIQKNIEDQAKKKQQEIKTNIEDKAKEELKKLFR